jgi:hypothetical protein
MHSVAEDSFMLRVGYWAWILVAVVGLGAYPAITGLVNKNAEGWAIWARHLGYLAFIVMIVENLRLSVYVPAEGQAFAGADDTVRKMIGGDNFHLSLDPNGWLEFSALGLSILIISLLALRVESLPRGWAIVGIIDAILLGLAVAGNITGVSILVGIAAILGGIILGPVWFIWIGIVMRRLEPEPTVGTA